MEEHRIVGIFANTTDDSYKSKDGSLISRQAQVDSISGHCRHVRLSSPWHGHHVIRQVAKVFKGIEVFTCNKHLAEVNNEES